MSWHLILNFMKQVYRKI